MSDTRSPDRIRAHYELEVALAARLRDAPPPERRALYGRVYDELFRGVPDHPQLRRRASPAEQDAYADEQVDLIRQFLPAGGSFLEVGAGDCATSRRVAAFAGAVTAVEVSADIVPADLPPNVNVVISDGVSIPVDAASVDLVYSNQLMEHLHPDDAADQLSQIARALRHGGRYVCITPNRLTGPHDISAAFDSEARGFHLREYTNADLRELLLGAGFSRVRVFQRAGGRALSRVSATLGDPAALNSLGTHAVVLPVSPYIALERVASALPGRPRDSRLMRRFLGVNVVAER